MGKHQAGRLSRKLQRAAGLFEEVRSGILTRRLSSLLSIYSGAFGNSCANVGFTGAGHGTGDMVLTATCKTEHGAASTSLDLTRSS